MALKVIRAFSPRCRMDVSEMKHGESKEVQQWHGQSEQKCELFSVVWGL